MWILIPFLPLLGFLINGLFGRKLSKNVVSFIGCSGPLLSFVLSVIAVVDVSREATLKNALFNWISVAGFSVDFALQIDKLTAVMILVVTGVGSIIHIYSIGYMGHDKGYARYFAYLNLFMFAMLILVMAKNLLLMFVGWEGVGLCSYLLIGFWYEDLKNADAGKKAFIVNRVGDLGFLLGIFFILTIFGTLDINNVQKLVPARISHRAAEAICLLLFIGACGKSAQIPLYVWLPDAMAGPTPVSALIHAATMVTAGVYMVCRLHFLYVLAPIAMEVIGVIACLTALFTAIIAVGQNDIKKVLAYSTISQLGFMFMAAATGGFSVSIFHLATHAFFKALLFLSAGAVIHALSGEQDIRNMGGLIWWKMKFICLVFVVGALAIAGFPLMAGFFSKDEILAHIYAQSKTFGGIWSAIWICALFTAFLTAFYMFRLVTLVFFGLPRCDIKKLEHVHQPDWSMKFALVVLAILSVVGGVVGHYIAPMNHMTEGARNAMEESHTSIVVLSILVSLFGIFLGFWLYLPKKALLERFTSTKIGSSLRNVTANKFYVDEIYEFLVVIPVKGIAFLAWLIIDRALIDVVLVNGPAKVVYKTARKLRTLHTGVLNWAVMVMLLGMIILFGLVLRRIM